MAEATAYELIAKGHFEVIEVLGKRRITKESFERWYPSQSFYRTVEDQEKDQDVLSTGYTVPQVARMLGIHRNNIHYLASKGRFETFQVGRHKCVTKESFERWYKSEPLHSGSGHGWIGKEMILWHPLLREKRSILWSIHTPMNPARSVRSGKPSRQTLKQKEEESG